MICFILIAIILSADQLLKGWVVGSFAGSNWAGEVFDGPFIETPRPLIPNVLGLNFATNTGGAWSLLSEHTWILTVIGIIVCIVVFVMLVKNYFPHALARIALSLVLAGALGNLIDRIRLGYVVDMFQTLFMHFPIFNIADICIVIGFFLFCIYLFFCDQPETRKPVKAAANTEAAEAAEAKADAAVTAAEVKAEEAAEAVQETLSGQTDDDSAAHN